MIQNPRINRIKPKHEMGNSKNKIKRLFDFVGIVTYDDFKRNFIYEQYQQCNIFDFSPNL